jgi:hypothetical protein
MILSEYIAGLQKILDEHGDLPCYYSSDEEGNSYKQLGYDGTVFYTPDLEYYLDTVYSSKEEFIEDYDEVNPIPICVVN